MYRTSESEGLEQNNRTLSNILIGIITVLIITAIVSIVTLN
jgi:hypothetical protein